MSSNHLKAERLSIAASVKQVRAVLIKQHMKESGIEACVCFSCGHASAALQYEDVPTIAIAPGGDLVAARWWRPEEIKRAWPNHFDATSGHLPVFLMARLAYGLRDYFIPEEGGCYEVPTGSGETLLALTMAYPEFEFVAVHDGTPSTEWNEESPLYRFIMRHQ